MFGFTKDAIKVYKKEVWELFKDKRTRNTTLIGPFATVCLVLFLFGFLLDNVSKASSQTVYVVGNAEGVKLIDTLKGIKTKVLSVASVEEGKKKISDGSARVVLNFASAAAGPSTVEEYFDPNQEAAGVTKALVDKTVEALNKVDQEKFLKTKGISPDDGKSYLLKEVKVEHGKASAGEILIGFLPYMIVIWAFYGGMGITGELVAGEKEKNTLETLLITPITRRDIAAGKLFALATICLASSLMTVAAVLFVASLHLPQTAEVFQKGLGVTPIGGLVMIAVLAPTVIVFASALLSVSARARNVREAYTSLSMLSFIVLTPALVSQFIGYTDFARAWWVSLIPVLNSATSIRQALLGNIDPASLALTIGSSLVIGFALLMYTVSLFTKEEVLLRV